MLKNMRVGTKLVAILIAPLVALGVLAGLGVADRLQGAADARRGERLGALAERAAAAAQALQLEQLRAVVLTGGAGGGSSDGDAPAAYERSVARSTGAISDLQAAIDGLNDGGRDLADRAAVLRDRMPEIDPLRQAVRDAQVDPAAVVERYRPVLASLDGVFVAAAGEPVAAGTAAYLQYLSILSRAKSATAEGFGHVAAIATGGLPPEVASSELGKGQAALAQANRRYETFFEEADPEFKALLRNVQSSSGARELDDRAARLGAGSGADAVGRPAPGSDGAVSLVDLVGQRLEGELEVQREITAALGDQAGDAEASAVRTARLYLLGAALGILAALGLAFLVARATARPLRQLTDAANQLAGEQLPRLVERLRTPDAQGEPEGLAPIPIASRDEIGQLARAFNQIQRTTTDVAQEQAALLRKGISDIFVNLARRNQALLDRQIEFIDQLESNEADPDQLENLFRLDHLATRMRRNAESLLVLAGADPPRRRGRPVPLSDVVRVAIGEVEDFARVNLLALEDVAVAANVAVDLSHVVAELMDNATQFSPPESPVEVVGRRSQDGSYVLSVSDQGIGMGAEQLAEANDELAHPPMMGLTLGRSLGFVVIGRLAARHDITVRLGAAPSGGIIALVILPSALLEEALTDGLPGADPRAVPLGRGAPAASPMGTLVAEAPAPPELAAAAVGAHAARGGAPAADASALETVGRANGQRPAAESVASTEERAGRTDGPLRRTGGPIEPSASGAGLLFPAPPPPAAAWPAPTRAPGTPSSDGGQSFSYRDDGEAASATDTVWVARLLAQPPERPTAPVAPAAPTGPADAAAPDPPEPPARGSDVPPPGPSAAPPPADIPAAGGDLPRRRPIGERPPTGAGAGADQRSGPAPAAPEPIVATAPGAAPVGPDPAGARPVDLQAPGPLQGAPAEAVPARGGELTAAGLVRRSPKQQIRDLTADASRPGTGRAPTSQRSPEEVRQILSRYRTGLQRGRTSGPSATAQGEPGVADRAADRGADAEEKA